MLSIRIPLRRALQLVLASLPAVLVSVAVLLAPEPSSAILRAAIGVLATVGCYEVLLYAAGCTSRVEPVLPIRLSLENPSPGKLLELVVTFILMGSVYRLLEHAFQKNYPIAAVLSVFAAYLLRRQLKSVFSGRSLRKKAIALSVAVALFSTSLSDADVRYLQTLLRLVEEVVRNALNT